MKREVTLAKRLTTLRRAIEKDPPSKGYLFSSIQNCQDYLDYCKNNGIQLESTNFRGTLYELMAMDLLKNRLHCNGLLKVGGANDQGVDIIGRWNLRYFWELSLNTFPLPRIVREIKQGNSMLHDAKEVQKILNFNSDRERFSLEYDISLLVQCKNYQKKIKVSTIRELTGTYMNHMRSTKRSFMFLISPMGLTKQAQILMDTLDIPMIHCKLSSLEADTSADVYKLANWRGGVLHSVYLNPYSRDVLQGINIETQIKLLLA